MRALWQNNNTSILTLDPKSLERKHASWQPMSKYPQKEKIGKRETKTFLATARLGPPLTDHDKTVPAANKS